MTPNHSIEGTSNVGRKKDRGIYANNLDVLWHSYPNRRSCLARLSLVVSHLRVLASQKLYFGPHHSFLAVAALLCFLFGANEIVQRLLIEVDGIVISSQTSTGNRPATTYLIRSTNGDQHQYVAGPTDQSLPRRLPEGTRISKRKYDLGWEQNGQRVNDFPLYFYVGACGLGGMLACWAFFQWRLNRPKNT